MEAAATKAVAEAKAPQLQRSRKAASAKQTGKRRAKEDDEDDDDELVDEEEDDVSGENVEEEDVEEDEDEGEEEEMEAVSTTRKRARDSQNGRPGGRHPEIDSKSSATSKSRASHKRHNGADDYEMEEEEEEYGDEDYVETKNGAWSKGRKLAVEAVEGTAPTKPPVATPLAAAAPAPAPAPTPTPMPATTLGPMLVPLPTTLTKETEKEPEIAAQPVRKPGSIAKRASNDTMDAVVNSSGIDGTTPAPIHKSPAMQLQKLSSSSGASAVLSSEAKPPGHSLSNGSLSAASYSKTAPAVAERMRVQAEEVLDPKWHETMATSVYRQLVTSFPLPLSPFPFPVSCSPFISHSSPLHASSHHNRSPFSPTPQKPPGKEHEQL